MGSQKLINKLFFILIQVCIFVTEIKGIYLFAAICLDFLASQQKAGF